MRRIKYFELKKKETCLELVNYLRNYSVIIPSKKTTFVMWSTFFHQFLNTDLPLSDNTILPEFYGIKNCSWKDILLNYLKAYQNITNF